MAFVKDENLLYGTLDSNVSVQQAGLCLKLASDGELELCSAGDRCIGVAAMTTEDPLNPGTYKTGVRIAYIRRGVVELVLPDDNAAISPGDLLATDDNGKVDKATIDTTDADSLYASLKAIVGIALESVDANSGGTIKAVLML